MDLEVNPMEVDRLEVNPPEVGLIESIKLYLNESIKWAYTQKFSQS